MNGLKKLQDRATTVVDHLQKIKKTIDDHYYEIYQLAHHSFLYYHYNLEEPKYLLQPLVEDLRGVEPAKQNWDKAVARQMAIRKLAQELGYTEKELVDIEQRAIAFVENYLSDKIKTSEKH